LEDGPEDEHEGDTVNSNTRNLFGAILIIVVAVAVITDEASGAAEYYGSEMPTVIWEADPDVIVDLLPAPLEYYGSEMLTVIWEADPDVIADLLPAPLKPYKRPLVISFIANFPETNFGVTYKMAVLAIVCQYGEEIGTYAVAMPENNDQAISAGREFYGFPKKMADIDFESDGDTVSGSVERRGYRVFELVAERGRAVAADDAAEILAELYPGEGGSRGIAFQIKGSLKADHTGVDFPPQLIRQVNNYRPVHVEPCAVEVTVRHSPYEPWWKMLEPVRIISAMLTRGNSDMQPAEIIGTVDLEAFRKDMRYSYDRGFGDDSR
jgi:acetoacetate decarboxylase